MPAWANNGRLAVDAEVIDDSHFIVQLRRCPECAQRFLWIFTEFVDWQGGDDAQHRHILPITESQAQAIARDGKDVDLAWLGSLGRGRRYLRTDWPTGRPTQTATWSSGPLPVTPGR